MTKVKIEKIAYPNDLKVIAKELANQELNEEEILEVIEGVYDMGREDGI